MEKNEGYIIGFGGKQWTLWYLWSEIVHNEYSVQNSVVYHNDYIQNLSFDLEKAKESFLAKTNNAKIQIDKDLKGSSFITRSQEEYVATRKEIDEYQYGKYSTHKLNEIDDVDYLRWYYFKDENTNSIESFCDAFVKFNQTFLVSFNIKKINEEENEWNTFKTEILFFETEKEKDLYIENYRYSILSNVIEDLSDTYFYDDKEKVDKDVILISSASVNTYYGTLYTYTFFCNEDNTRIVYGGSKEYDITKFELVRIKGTIQHKFNDYHNRKETKIQRMKIIK